MRLALAASLLGRRGRRLHVVVAPAPPGRGGVIGPLPSPDGTCGALPVMAPKMAASACLLALRGDPGFALLGELHRFSLLVFADLGQPPAQWPSSAPVGATHVRSPLCLRRPAQNATLWKRRHGRRGIGLRADDDQRGRAHRQGLAQGILRVAQRAAQRTAARSTPKGMVTCF